MASHAYGTLPPSWLRSLEACAWVRHTPPGIRDAVAGAQLSRATVRRIWSFARPYRRTIALFLVAILAAALLALVPPLVVRAILDTAIPDGDRAMITVAGRASPSLAALGDAALAVVQRWCSARVGEGLIYDLRRALFAKVQRMPIAFFTRSPTGALISRLNNDVIGAQTAVTSTLGSVVSNVVVLVTTLAAMLALEWRLTLLALVVLPMFVIPARRVGRTLQDISRQQMQHNATMSTQMTERFNVAGAMLVKLFGDHHREDAAFERPRRAACATPGSAAPCTAACSSSPSASSGPSGRRRSTASAPTSSSPAS